MYTYMYSYVYTHTCVRVYVCMYIYIYIYMYIYIYIYTYASEESLDLFSAHLEKGGFLGRIRDFVTQPSESLVSEVCCAMDCHNS